MILLFRPKIFSYADICLNDKTLRRHGDVSSRICSGLGTRQRGASRSLIDYAAVSSEQMNAVLSMTVDENGQYGGGSDHN